jgi:hypothetical protein
MANQSKLKAWVRIDGGGTVVGSGPIFSLKKPKVGKWREMNANLCCNSTPSSTTTTSTTNGGGTTPTAWVAYTANNPYSACQQTGGNSTVLYTSVSTLAVGVTFYQDAALTIPYNSLVYGSAVNVGGTLYPVADGGGSTIVVILSCAGFTTTTTTTGGLLPFNFGGSWSFMDRAEACGGLNAGTYFSNTPYGAVGDGTQIYTNPTGTTTPHQPFIKINGVSYANTAGLLSLPQIC